MQKNLERHERSSLRQTTQATTATSQLQAAGFDREAVFQARHGRPSKEFYEHLSRVVMIPHIGHVMAACLDPKGGFKSAAECRRIEKRLARSEAYRCPRVHTKIDL